MPTYYSRRRISLKMSKPTSDSIIKNASITLQTLFSAIGAFWKHSLSSLDVSDIYWASLANELFARFLAKIALSKVLSIAELEQVSKESPGII